jgi:hypothetical protein
MLCDAISIRKSLVRVFLPNSRLDHSFEEGLGKTLFGFQVFEWRPALLLIYEPLGERKQKSPLTP